MSEKSPLPAAQRDAVIADTLPPAPKDAFERPSVPGRSPDKIPRNFGRYRIIECVGRGGMGAVFKAIDTQLDREVALKVPFLGDDNDDTRERFYREARAAATIQHAYICPVFDVGEFNHMPYLTMAFIEGRSLAQARAAGQMFSMPQIALLVRKLCLAMQEAHNKKVVHRDLKPANIILRPNNEPMIMDFGLARRNDDQRSKGLTQQGDIIGTVDYMSKEQVEGENDKVGAPADIYSMGVILYELIAGRRPFEGSTTAVLVAITSKDPKRPSELRNDVPAKLEEICLKAMSREIKDRYPSMGHMATALAEYLRLHQQNAAPIATPPPAPAAPALPSADTAPIKDEAAPTNPDNRNKTPRAKTLELEEESPKSGRRSGSRRGRQSGRRPKAKKKSMTPLIVGVAAAVLVGLLICVALIVFWPKGDKNSAQATSSPPQNGPVVMGPRPTSPGPSPAPVKPTVPTQPATQPPSKPRGFDVSLEPASVNLAVGQPQKVTLKLQRKEYKGSINFSWTTPPGVRITPASPVMVNPGQPDPVLTVQLPAGVSDEFFKLEITATPANEQDRGTVKTSLDVVLQPSACIRVVEVNRPQGNIDVMAFSPDASIVLIGGGAGAGQGPGGSVEEKNAIQVWNVERGEAISKLAGHTNIVTGLSVSADGKTALSVSADDTIATWDLAQGRKKHQTVKLPVKLLTAVMSPGAERALVVYVGIMAKVYLDAKFSPAGKDLPTAPLVGRSPDDAVKAVALAPDRKTAVLGGIDGKLFLLDWTDKTKPKPLVGHSEAVLCAAYAPSGGLIATAGGGVLQAGTLQPGKDNTVRLWDASDQSLKWTSENHAKPVVCLAFSSNGKYVASGGSDGEIRVWNVEDGKSVAAFPGHTGRIFSMTFTPDGTKLWSAAADRTLRCWKLP